MNPTCIRLGGPSDILAVLPYQLGFHPRDSLVVVSLHGTRMGLVQRIDLPAVEQAPRAVRALLPALLREAPDGVLLLGYESTTGDALPLIAAMGSAAGDVGLAVRDRIVVRDGRWSSLQCDDPSCCPAGGRPLPAAHEVPAVAEFVGREVSPMVDRAALADRLRPAGPPAADVVAACADDWLAARRVAAEGTAAAFEDVRRRELQTWATVLRCRDEDGPMPSSPRPSWPGWRSRSPTSTSATRWWPGSARAPSPLTWSRRRCVSRWSTSCPPRCATTPNRGSTRPSTRPVRSGWSAGSWECAPRFPRPGAPPR